MNIHDLQLHFSIRKLSVGVVSCLIGICFISSNQTVQADSMSIASNNKSVIISNSSSNSNPTETKSSNKQDIVDSNNTSPTQIDSHSNQNSTKSNPTETIASKSNNKQNIVDSNNTSPTQINSHSNQNSTKTTLVNFKLNVSSQQPAATDSAENKLETAALNPTIDEKLDAKMLAESKTTAQAKDTNGGFDASWGKLDVNNWKGSVQGDCYQLTDYTGDANHVIVPNEADFAKAGISTSGKQVGVTSGVMHIIFRKANTDDATVAFSKTNNKIVKAIGRDWSDTWGHPFSDDPKAELSKFDGTNLDVSNVTDMHYMFHNNHISDLSSLTNWNVGQVTDMSYMFASNHISDLKPLTNWNDSNVTNMDGMFASNHISDLGPLANWKVDSVTNMSGMFINNHISDLRPLANWKVYDVTDMSWMFDSNHISDLSPLANWSWRVYKVMNMRHMFDNNSSTQTDPAKRIINFVYPAGYTGKKQYSVTQTVDVQREVKVELTTKDSKPSTFKSILEWVTKTETPETPNPVYFPAYTVPEVYGLVPSMQIVDDKVQADPNNPITVTVTYTAAPVIVHFQDVDPNADKDSNAVKQELGTPVQLSGAYGANVDLKGVNLPENFVIAELVPANAKFGTISSVIVKLKHVTRQSPEEETEKGTRTIIVHLPNGTIQTIVQTISLKRNTQKDLVTGIISSTAPWGLDEANSSFTINGVKQTQTAYKQNSNIITFSSIKLPKVPGYKAKVTRNNGLLMVSYLVFAPEKLEANNNLSELQFSNKLATNSAVQFNSAIKSNIVVKSDMYQVVNDDHNWQLPVIKSYDLKFVTNKNQIIFAYTKDKQYNYRFVLTFKDGQYRLATFDKQNKLLKTYSIKSYKKLAKIIHSLVLINIA